MMRVNRRSVLKGGSVLGAAAAIPMAQALRAQEAALLVYDSAIAESASMARGHMGAALDVTAERKAGWPSLRAGFAQHKALEGLTGWSDYVTIREELKIHGFRIAAETPSPAPISGKSHLFRWSLGVRR